METTSCKLECFEDPLGLLFHLIEKNKIGICDIPIVKITAQYLDYVHHMEQEDLNVVNEFLVMTTTLLDIKAKMPLPKKTDEGEREINPRAKLVMRLLGYKEYRPMADELIDREDGAPKYLCKPPTLPPEVAKYKPAVDLDKLLDGPMLTRLQRIFEQVMERKEDKINFIRSNLGTTRKEPVNLGQKMGSILSYARRKRRFSFRKLLEGQPDKPEMVAIFLAVPELMKIGKIHLSRERTSEDMDIGTLEQEGKEEEPDLAQLGDFEG